MELDGDDRARLDMLESYMAGVGGDATEGGSAGEESPAPSTLKRALARSSPRGHSLLQRSTRLLGGSPLRESPSERERLRWRCVACPELLILLLQTL